jgi:hypothetical protein
MKHFKARLLVLCSLMVLIAAALAPIAADAQAYGPRCPTVSVGCPGSPRSCAGKLSSDGQTCVYDYNCLNCR